MADAEYPDDIQFAGLVQAATAAADEQTRSSKALGKRKRGDDGLVGEHPPIDHNLMPSTPLHEQDMDDSSIQLHNSASVLFREPSVKSKKYSRPPLSKVYTSLELAPEHFLKLQAAGKDFMLDPDHPERRDVVGHRKHSDGNDVAKLKLWNCVEEFLHNTGYGEKFFGHDAGEGIPGAPARTLFWPQDAQKLIKLCMPLMRKMVTNERQRVYAAETRKQTPSKKDEERSPTVQSEPGPVARSTRALAKRDKPEGEAVSPGEQEMSTPTKGPAPPAPNQKSNPAGSVVLYVNLVPAGGTTMKRIIPRFSLLPENAANLASLKSEIQKRLKAQSRQQSSAKDLNLDSASIKVWMSDGLVPVNDDGEWMVALLSAGTVEWMDGEVRVLVEV